MQLVGDELVILRRDCVEGIVACEEHGVTVKEAVLAMGLLNEADADRLIDPILMTDPEAMARAIAEFRARIDG